MRKHFKKADPKLLDNWINNNSTQKLSSDNTADHGTHHKSEIAQGTANNPKTLHSKLSASDERKSTILAIITPIAFLLTIGIMLNPSSARLTTLQGVMQQA